MRIIVQETDTVVVTAITEGPQGPAGAAGVAGAAGPTGPQGPQGVPGTDAGGALTSIGGIPDVDITSKTDTSVLYYNAATAKFRADNINTILTLTDYGNF